MVVPSRGASDLNGSSLLLPNGFGSSVNAVIMVADTVNRASYVGRGRTDVVLVQSLRFLEHQVVSRRNVIMTVGLDALDSVISVKAKLL